MFTYTLSRREKALLLALGVVVLLIIWFVFVFQRTTNEITSMDSEISAIETQKTTASAQVQKMHYMQESIAKYKAAGVAPTPIPYFDNMTPLMSELNRILSVTTNYSLSFDELDTETSPEYVLRGVTADFTCDSFASAEAVVTALARGQFACNIDSVAISDSSAGRVARISGATGPVAVTASVHITFFEKYPPANG